MCTSMLYTWVATCFTCNQQHWCLPPQSEASPKHHSSQSVKLLVSWWCLRRPQCKRHCTESPNVLSCQCCAKVPGRVNLIAPLYESGIAFNQRHRFTGTRSVKLLQTQSEKNWTWLQLSWKYQMVLCQSDSWRLWSDAAISSPITRLLKWFFFF